MRDYQISQRRACELIGVESKTVRRRRFGNRRVGVMLERNGMIMNHKQLYRLYGEEGLSVRRRRGRKPTRGIRTSMPVPLRPGDRWSMDFGLTPSAPRASSVFWRSTTTAAAKTYAWS